MAPIAVGATWRSHVPGLGPIPYYLDRWFDIDLRLGMFAHQAFLTTVVMDIWHWTPLVTLTMLAGLAGLPKEPFEQAQVDGANRFQIFWYITLPMLRPVILTTVFIRLMDAMRTVDEVWMLTGGGRAPPPATSGCTSGAWSSPRPTTATAPPCRCSPFTSPSCCAGCCTWRSCSGAREPRPADGERRSYLALGAWVALTVITLFPIYWMFVVSGKSRVELFGRPSFLITSFFTENYTNVLNDAAFQGYMINSMIVATSNAVLVTLLALLATYAMSRYALAGKDNIFFWTITNRMAPPAVFLLPLFLLFTKVFVIGDWSLFDTRTGLILLYCVFNLPFAIWLLKGIIDAIPVELDEAAMLDGAGTWQVLTRVIVPLARPGSPSPPSSPGCSRGTSTCSRPLSPRSRHAPSRPGSPSSSR